MIMIIKKIKKRAKSLHNFNYTGDITVKLTEGDRVYSEQHFHNTGCAKLFNFVADCLTGNFNAAKSSRPCRIVLFKLDPIEDEENTTFNRLYWNDDTRVSTKVIYDSAVTPGATIENGSTVTYHFRIPYLCLVDGAEVRKLGLYPDIISSYSDDLCAYYILPSDEKIVVPTGGSNFTIIID